MISLFKKYGQLIFMVLRDALCWVFYFKSYQGYNPNITGGYFWKDRNGIVRTNYCAESQRKRRYQSKYKALFSKKQKN